MGGIDSDMFLYFKSLLLRGLMAARKHHRRIVSLAEIMSAGEVFHMPILILGMLLVPLARDEEKSETTLLIIG